MTDHSPVELFTGTDTSSELEKLNTIGSVSNGLVTLCPHLPRTFQGIIRLPVLLARSLFHQKKRSILQSAHEIMAHGSQAPRRIVSRIVIPGNDVHFFCPFEIIQFFIRPHKVGGNNRFFIIFSDRITLIHVILQHAVRIEPLIVDGHAGKGTSSIPEALTQSIRCYDFFPVIERMSPEFCIPGLVHCIQCAIFFSQPYTESLLTVFTIAGSAVFIAYMPAFHMRVGSISFCKLRCQSCGVFPENLRIWTGIMALPEFMMLPVKIRTFYLRIFSCHPCRNSSGGSSKNNIVILLAQHLDNLIQFRKIIFFLGRLNFCPGKHIDGSTVDTGIPKDSHIFLPYFSRPLIGVIISPI